MTTDQAIDEKISWYKRLALIAQMMDEDDETTADPSYILRAIRESDPIYADPDCWNIVYEASKSFVAEEWTKKDLVCDRGFLILEESSGLVIEKGPHDGPDPVRAICWSTFVETEEGPFTEFSFLVGLAENSWTIVPVKEGQHIEEVSGPWKNIVPFVQTFNRIAGQTLIVPSRERPSRAARRRALREQFVEEVVRVSLRRTKHRKLDADSAGVDWQHQWLVRGHWRWQFYPRTNDNRQIWIMPYIKGPEDKPFIEKQRVFHFNR